MNLYSSASKNKLSQCDERLQRVFYAVLQIVDHTIITGHRPEAEQNEMYRTGKSQLKWPEGEHNEDPSKAVDAAPYPIDWKDRERMTLFAGVVLGVAHEMGIKLRWGGNWKMDFNVKENHFDDLLHFELVD